MTRAIAISALQNPNLLPLNFQVVNQSGIEARESNEEALLERLGVGGREDGSSLMGHSVPTRLLGWPQSPSFTHYEHAPFG